MAKTRAAKLGNKAVAAVAATVALLVALASLGHGTVALVGAGALYLLVGKGVTVPPHAWRTLLRWAGWTVVSLLLVAVSHGITGPGGNTVGLALGAALATVLHFGKR